MWHKGGVTKDDSHALVLNKWVEASWDTVSRFLCDQPQARIFKDSNPPLPFVANLLDYPSTPNYALYNCPITVWVGEFHPLDIASKHLCLRCGLELFCLFSRNDLQGFVFVCLCMFVFPLAGYTVILQSQGTMSSQYPTVLEVSGCLGQYVQTTCLPANFKYNWPHYGMNITRRVIKLSLVFPPVTSCCS